MSTALPSAAAPREASPVVRGISSMATRLLLADLGQACAARTGVPVAIESVGGVDAARRVMGDEPFDIVVLASNAIEKLMAAGKLIAGSRVDLVHCGVAVAVKAGDPLPDISSEAAVRAAVLAAPRLSYSTGPSGVALAQLFERWGIAQQIGDRTVTPPPGTPVGALLARGEVALGFQQLSELLHVPGVTVVGPLPPAIQITTTFSAAVCATCQDRLAAQAAIDFLASAETAEAKRRQGMDPA